MTNRKENIALVDRVRVVGDAVIKRALVDCRDDVC